jgi:hypothetical protein
MFLLAALQPPAPPDMARSTRSHGFDLTVDWSSLGLTMAPPGALRLDVDRDLSRATHVVQYGVFATQKLSRGTRLMWYGGVLRSEKDVKAGGVLTHARRLPNTGLILDGAPLIAALPRTADALAHTTLPADVSAMGFMCNTSPTRRDVNVRYEYVPYADMDVPCLVASRDIAAGQQILCYYGNPLKHEPFETPSL